MGFVGKINLGGSSPHAVGNTLYGTCSTPADTQTKVVSLSSLTNLMECVCLEEDGVMCDMSGNDLDEYINELLEEQEDDSNREGCAMGSRDS